MTSNSEYQQAVAKALEALHRHGYELGGGLAGGFPTMTVDEALTTITLAVERIVPPKADERLNITNGTQYSPPQLVDIEAKGFNACRTQMLEAINKNKL